MYKATPIKQYTSAKTVPKYVTASAIRMVKRVILCCIVGHYNGCIKFLNPIIGIIVPSYNFEITIRLTYEELCIKFSIKQSPTVNLKMCLVYDESIFIVDVYYETTARCFERPCKQLQGKFMKNLVFDFLTLYRNTNYDFSTTKLLAHFRDFDIFPNIFFLSLKNKILRKIEDFSCIIYTKKKLKYFENLTYLRRLIFELQPYKRIDLVEN
ncbi:hypothetical protein AGLY_007733 [Aphis glycines]|uniref:Uncharacterized protein n=1 Tax=Aphis glycines TaxID=307491 RepID=A0A6G0TMV3_APHGL|nr:hypothetical protein AGLY_007733 [Aphis glycines]